LLLPEYFHRVFPAIDQFKILIFVLGEYTSSLHEKYICTSYNPNHSENLADHTSFITFVLLTKYLRYRMTQILLLDHEGLMHTTLDFKLQKAGMSPVYCTPDDDLASVFNNNDIAAAITDIDMDKSIVEEILDFCIKNDKHSVPLLGITNLEDEEQILYWLNRGMHDFIAKPYKTSEIIIRIKKALSISEVRP